MSTSRVTPVFNLFVVLCALGLSGTLACTPTYSKAAKTPEPSQDSTQQVKPPRAGLRVIEVEGGGAAQRAGMRTMDVIYEYGEFEVVDSASYYVARDAYEKKAGSRVQLSVWRDGGPIKMTVTPGPLGIDTNDYNPVSYQFEALMDQLNVAGKIPEDMLREAMEKGAIKPREGILEEARRLLDTAEREGTLTPAQVLVGRIYMTLDDAAPEDLRRQAELLRQLRSTQPRSYVSSLGHEKFFEHKRYRAAVECFKHQLEADPSDVATRLNMGIAYNKLGMFDEAAAAADYVLGNKLPLSGHGFIVAHQVKALSALGRGDYPGGMAYAEKLFESRPNDYRMSLWQLAAALNGDLQKFYEVSRRCQEALPGDYERLRLTVDAVEAYALSKNGQQDRARQTIMKWKDTPRAAQKVNYWKQYPGGAEVVKTWEKFLGSGV